MRGAVSMALAYNKVNVLIIILASSADIEGISALHDTYFHILVFFYAMNH